eukprot:scaffold3243_cov47-Attheya_sp.AAC.4
MRKFGSLVSGSSFQRRPYNNSTVATRIMSTRSEFGSNTNRQHYESHTAESYESAFFYSPGAYTAHLRELVQQALHLNSNHLSYRRLLDIGGGTGNFTKLLLDNSPVLKEAVVVDPFLSTVHDSSENGISFVKASSNDFMKGNSTTNNESLPSWRQNYHQVLLKEVVHHFDEQHRTSIFRGIRQGLINMTETNSTDSPPSILIITRPHRNIDYPLWPAALEVWAANQPSAHELCKNLKGAGFSSIHQWIEPYQCETTLEQWLNMVRARFWSTFSNFSNKELEEACQYISNHAKLQPDGKTIKFEDRLVFITAHK